MKAAASAVAQAEQELRDAEDAVRELFRRYGSDPSRDVMLAAQDAIRARSRALRVAMAARRQAAEVTP